jgi:hypothetical protein
MEAGTGVALLLSPSLVAALILGGSLDGPAAPVVARLAGAALLAIGVACWLWREDVPGRASRGLVGALLLYNVAAAAQFQYSTPVPPGIAIPKEVRSPFGTLKFFDGVPDQASTQKIYDNLDFSRAMQA